MKKRNSKNLGDFHISDSDIGAIVCALPLVSMVKADSFFQTLRNKSACSSAGSKLLNHSADINAEEIRVIAVSINLALLVLSDQVPEFSAEIDPTWMAELSSHRITLNRLGPIFDRFVDDIEAQL